ncbi:hypothetical protein [Emticicia sp. SJ17W-69]|uniref:hypothetical protein n=1 Tax=Emticicia sp. SJ17W-69 TaxID=3421657 RepID=UPI003EC0EE3F
MKKKFFILLLLISNLKSLAQTQQLDSLFTIEGLFFVNVTEITKDEVKYKFPNEDLLNVIPKNTVLRIRLKSGRNLTFLPIFNPINSPNQWSKVKVVYTESEVKGAIKLTEPISNDNKSWLFRSASKVQLKSLEKFKKQTAMLGGNLVYLSSHKADAFGIPYSSRKLVLNDYVKYHGNKMEFQLTKKEEFNFNSQSEIESKLFPSQIVTLEDFQEKKDGLYVNTKIPKLANAELHKIIYVDSKKVILMLNDKSRIINYTLSKLE